MYASKHVAHVYSLSEKNTNFKSDNYLHFNY